MSYCSFKSGALSPVPELPVKFRIKPKLDLQSDSAKAGNQPHQSKLSEDGSASVLFDGVPPSLANSAGRLDHQSTQGYRMR